MFEEDGIFNADQFPTIFFQSGKEQSQKFAFNFAKGYRHFVLRLTGGCELSDEHAAKLVNLEAALAGVSPDGKPQPKFTGFGLFGGTRFKEMDDPEGFIPGITEVFPKIAPQCPGAVFLGVVAKQDMMRYSKWGLVVKIEDKKRRFTVVHPGQKSILVVQPSVDIVAPWYCEFQECFKLCEDLRVEGWESLLVCYNGGDTVDKEIQKWAEAERKILIIRGSGRICDDYAIDTEFLSENPWVCVADNTVESIREQLLALGALTWPEGKRPGLRDPIRAVA